MLRRLGQVLLARGQRDQRARLRAALAARCATAAYQVSDLQSLQCLNIQISSSCGGFISLFGVLSVVQPRKNPSNLLRLLRCAARCPAGSNADQPSCCSCLSERLSAPSPRAKSLRLVHHCWPDVFHGAKGLFWVTGLELRPERLSIPAVSEALSSESDL